MNKDGYAVVRVIIAAVVILLIFGGLGMGGYGMMGFGMGPGFLFMLLFWGAVIWIIVAMLSPSQGGRGETEDALTILKRRYAHGEITKSQFEEMKKDLRGLK